MTDVHIGEFEQMLLLAILQCGREAYSIEIRRELEERAGRVVSRGALYRTFDRLAAKGLLEWDLEDGSPVPERGGHPMRRFRVTKPGLAALREARAALMRLWEDLDGVLEES